MDAGVIILNVSDVADIQFVSHIHPDPNFPDVPGLFSAPNARGLFKLSDETLLVANDHGGLRWIDISNIEAPVETGKYMNADLYDVAAPAYNNIAVKDHYAYVPVDYCGLDVIDVSDSDMENVYWFNPWECSLTNWVGRPGHTNEAVIKDDLLFISGADSEVLAFDISTPATPVLVGQYAFPFDSVVTWSVDVNANFVSLALVNNSIAGFPYYSNVGGIALLQYDVVTAVSDLHETLNIRFFPNPVKENLNINFIGEKSGDLIIKMYDSKGNLCYTSQNITGSFFQIDMKNFSSGIYCLQTYSDAVLSSTQVLVKQ
jgi:hypothetical protein